MDVQPPNFSWVLPGRLAGLALPRLPAHYQFLLDQGVRHLVSLTERGPPHNDSCPGLTLHRLRIPDFCPPAPEQIDRFVQIVDEANARGEMKVHGGVCLHSQSLALRAIPSAHQLSICVHCHHHLRPEDNLHLTRKPTALESWAALPNAGPAFSPK
ncbi:dual specificity protein phosphatase 23 isoform X1 [Pteropus medius]|uniref:Dual specificity protein phosphatase 23 isoform X1 n=1 Tax=Pteropus vampyrus TaxID=132908 RepID=A0A6P6D382_PTEVA|nr:dual specificity protein phosphatase 23 isoform X1 [Pteropus vampyrus]XP_039695946.1 dual specificity protein phosphatase 23 isoform X1 [Pteropus giganteus]